MSQCKCMDSGERLQQYESQPHLLSCVTWNKCLPQFRYLKIWDNNDSYEDKLNDLKLAKYLKYFIAQ